MSEPESKVAAEYEALLQFLYLAPVGLVQATLDGEIVMINPISAQLLMPLSRDGNLTNLFVALESVAPELRALTVAFGGGRGMVCDALHIQLRAGVRGKLDPQMLSISLVKLDDRRLMAVLSDATEQVRRERLLRQNEAWLNAVLTGVNDYVLASLDSEGRIDNWNSSIGRVTGFTAESVRGQLFSMFDPPGATTPERLLDSLREADENGWSLDEGWRMKSDGTKFWGSAMISPLRERCLFPAAGRPGAGDSEPQGYCLVIRDITDRREASETLRKATSCDLLTGLANRRTFFERADAEIRRCKRSPRPLSLVMYDADFSKRVNDTHGQQTGDAVLRHLTALLIGSFREVDLIARTGEEEFAVLLPSTDASGAVQVAERLREVVESTPYEADGVRIACTVSGGVATLDSESTDLDALMKQARLALGAAKAAGRNRIECWIRGPSDLPVHLGRFQHAD